MKMGKSPIFTVYTQGSSHPHINDTEDETP